MWKMEWQWKDCQWVITSPLGYIVARTYNKELGRLLLKKYKKECAWRPNDGKEKEETKNEEEKDIRPDGQ